MLFMVNAANPMALSLSTNPPRQLFHSDDLDAIQKRQDSPFGMLFLTVPQPKPPLPYMDTKKKLTTQDTEETSNDGKSKLDPLYDEDDEEDEEIPETY